MAQSSSSVQAKPIKKKGYFVSDNDEFGIAVVASSAKEAKKIGYRHLHSEYGSDSEWIDVRVQYKKKAKVDDLPIGVIEDSLRALQEGIFGFIEGEACPECCFDTGSISNDNGFIGCDDCIEKHQEEANGTI